MINSLKKYFTIITHNKQQRIRDAFGTINQAMLTNVINDFRIRLELCLEEEGGIFEHRL
jgi:hypothetical protein